MKIVVSGEAQGARETEVAPGETKRTLLGVPGVRRWSHEAVADFVRHSLTQGREQEAVGIFVLEPAYCTEAGESEIWVNWLARYVPMTNQAVNSASNFDISVTELEMIYHNALIRQEEFFKELEERAEASSRKIQGKRYNPMVGIGHSHPRGTASLSQKDVSCYAAWKQFQDQFDGNGKITRTEHFVYCLGSSRDTLLAIDAEGVIVSSAAGDFAAAVQ